MIIAIFFIVFCYILKKDLRKGIIAIFVFSAFLDSFRIISNCTLLTALVILSSITYLYSVRKEQRLFLNFPIAFPSLLLAASYIVSDTFSTAHHYGTLIAKLFTLLIFIYIVWLVYSESPQETIKSAINTVCIYAAIITIYGFIELVLKKNYFVDCMSAQGYYPYNYDLQIRYGLKRCYSIFAMHITNGFVSIETFIFLLFSYLRGWTMKKWIIPLLILLAVNIFATGSRSIILAFVICLSSVLVNLNILRKVFIPSIIIMLLFVLFLNDYTEVVYNSFIDTKSVEGSSDTMRELQWQTTLYFWSFSPWLGNGITFTGDILELYKSELFGAESLWMPIFMNLGLFGVFAFLSYFLATTIICLNSDYKPSIFIVASFSILYFMTSVPNIECTHFFIYLVMILYICENPKEDYTFKNNYNYFA